MQPVDAVEHFEMFQLPRRERRGLVEHRPVRPREVEREEVHAFTRQIAREVVHRHEFGMDVGPELLLALRELQPAGAIRGRIACGRERDRREGLPRQR